MALIELEHLYKIYRDEGVETPALHDISFSVDGGNFIAVMGPSGSGKSTLLHILGFLDHPTSGIYRFDGKPVLEYTGDELAHLRNQRMGFVFQTFNLLPRANVLENVKLPLFYSSVPEHEWNHRAHEAIEAVGMGHRLHHEPSQLSGGERQRVAIARALVNHPSVIFADEPTGNLDTKSGQMVMEILQRLNEEEHHTIVLITHETYTAEHAERIIHILDGRMSKDESVTRRLSRHHFEK